MKRPVILVLVMAALACISGYLLSKASFVGRTGINLFYKEYKFLKTGWQGALVVFVVLLMVLFIHQQVQKRMTGKKQLSLHFAMLLVALAGLYFTYADFRESLAHRLLGERFHLGAYLFWIGWMTISIVYLLGNKQQPLPE